MRNSPGGGGGGEGFGEQWRSRVQLQLYYIADLCRDSLVPLAEHWAHTAAWPPGRAGLPQTAEVITWKRFPCNPLHNNLHNALRLACFVPRTSKYDNYSLGYQWEVKLDSFKNPERVYKSIELHLPLNDGYTVFFNMWTVLIVALSRFQCFVLFCVSRWFEVGVASLDKHAPNFPWTNQDLKHFRIHGARIQAIGLWPNTRSNQSASYEEVLAATGVV